MRVTDVTTPALPVELGSIGGSAHDVEVVGDLAYVAGGGLRVIDDSNPALPV